MLVCLLAVFHSGVLQLFVFVGLSRVSMSGYPHGLSLSVHALPRPSSCTHLSDSRCFCCECIIFYGILQKAYSSPEQDIRDRKGISVEIGW